MPDSDSHNSALSNLLRRFPSASRATVPPSHARTHARTHDEWACNHSLAPTRFNLSADSREIAFGYSAAIRPSGLAGARVAWRAAECVGGI